MMGIGLERALDLVEHDLRKNWHTREQHCVDVWRPDDSPGRCFTEDSGGRRRLKPPRIMADDGNFLLAVVPYLAEQSTLPEDKFARDLDLLGNMLRRAALNLGLHRLIVLMVLPENKAMLLAIPSPFATEKPGAGRFRVVVLPDAEADEDEFIDNFVRRRAVVGPLPIEPFLEDVDEAQLAQYVDEVIADMDPPQGMKDAIRSDLEALMRGETDGERDPWLHTIEKIDSRVNAANTATIKEGL